VLILFLILAAGAGVYAFRSAGRGPSNKIVVSGNIELTEVNIAFKTSGRLVERAVTEGDTVKKGQIVARLDRDQLSAQRDRESAGVAASEALFEQSRTALEWQRATLAADIEQRKADLAAAEARLSELKNGARPQERLDARAAVEAAQAEADRARRDYERAQVLHGKDDISTSQLDQARARADSAAAALKSAREREALVLAGPRAEIVNAQTAQVERARAAVKMAEANALELKR